MGLSYKELSEKKLKSMKKGRPLKGRRRRIRVKGILLTGFFLLCSVASLPILWHIKDIRAAQDSYDFERLAKEMTWVKEKTPWLVRIPLVRDSEFWLKLNQGEFEGLERELAVYPDDKHRFWLFQVHLLKNQEDQAQNLIQELQSVSRRAIAEGLLAATQGDTLRAREKIRSAADSELDHEGRILKNLSLARMDMAQNDLSEAEEALKRAKGESPQYPLVWVTEFDLLLANGEWEQAKQLEVKLKEIPGYSERPDFLIKKALLALTVGEHEVLDKSINQLGELENGNSYQEYLNGIESYQQGQFKEAVAHFKKSLDQDLPDQFRKDAEKALAQAFERVSAESALVLAKKKQ